MPCIFVNKEIVPHPVNMTTDLKQLRVPLINDELLEKNIIHGSNKNPKLYKTKLCKNWASNLYCMYGSECQFAHGYGEMKGYTQ